MANKMLIDATHPEETRVVVLRGNRVEEFDFESAQRKQLRGNIYLAKVTRVEPSLQAAFVDYGGNRHGFLAFSEIHPDYYQIPVADREALIAEEERAQRAADDEVDRRSRRHRRQPAHRSGRRDQTVQSDVAEAHGDNSAAEEHFEEAHGRRAHATSRAKTAMLTSKRSAVPMARKARRLTTRSPRPLPFGRSRPMPSMPRTRMPKRMPRPTMKRMNRSKFWRNRQPR